MTATTRRRVHWILLVVVAVCLVGGTAYTGTESGLTDWLGAVSAYAAAFAGPVMVVGVWYWLDWAVLDHFDTWRELRDGNLAVALFVVGLLLSFALCFLGALSAPAQPVEHTAHVDTAEKYIGVTEKPPGSNEGKHVERFLAEVGLDGGYPWCAAAVSAWMDWAGVDAPTREDGNVIRTALATDFLDARCVIDAGEVLRGREEVPRGAVAVWRRGNSKFGHTGPVVRWDRRCGVTIEGNTTPPDGAGSQREGDGVYRRTRCIRPHSHFRIVGFARPSC